MRKVSFFDKVHPTHYVLIESGKVTFETNFLASEEELGRFEGLSILVDTITVRQDEDGTYHETIVRG